MLYLLLTIDRFQGRDEKLKLLQETTGYLWESEHIQGKHRSCERSKFRAPQLKGAEQSSAVEF